jgi:hypothetical protein
MDCDIFSWDREVSERKGNEAVKARRQIEEGRRAVCKIAVIFGSAAGDGRAGSRSSVGQWPIMAASGSDDRQCAVSEIMIRVRNCTGVGVQ